jgi:hypothetical protein
VLDEPTQKANYDNRWRGRNTGRRDAGPRIRARGRDGHRKQNKKDKNTHSRLSHHGAGANLAERVRIHQSKWLRWQKPPLYIIGIARHFLLADSTALDADRRLDVAFGPKSCTTTVGGEFGPIDGGGSLAFHSRLG